MEKHRPAPKQMDVGSNRPLVFQKLVYADCVLDHVAVHTIASFGGYIKLSLKEEIWTFVSLFAVHIAQVILHLGYRKHLVPKHCLKFPLENLQDTQEKLETMKMQNIGR